MQRMRFFAACALFIVFACAGVGATVASPAPAPYAPSFIPTKSHRLVLLDIGRAGPRLVAVGERGVVMTSDDGGSSWKAQRTSTTRTLTGLAFTDAQRGVAVGHGAAILRTEDGGMTWIAVELPDAGTDSFLGVSALGGSRLVAYGAFGLFAESIDDGRTWTRHAALDKDFDRHISRVFRAGDQWVLVGESATLAVSDDASRWIALKSPYVGSLFGGLTTKRGAWLIYGMRGNVFRSDDRGVTWTKVETGTQLSVMNGTVLADGRIVLVGISGLVLVSADDGRSFARADATIRQGIAQVLPVDKHKLLLTGDAGVGTVDLDAPGSRRSAKARDKTP